MVVEREVREALEDGDRTEGLVRRGKKIITVDLNPMSRTTQYATVTIVDNVVRAMPLLISEVERLKGEDVEELKKIVDSYSNREVLSDSMKVMLEKLKELSEKGVYLELHDR